MKKRKETEALGFRKRMQIRESLGGKFANFLMRAFGTVWFLITNFAFFANFAKTSETLTNGTNSFVIYSESHIY